VTTDWYVLFGHPERRRWEDARRFGFVSGGGGPRWSRRLHDLDVGDQVFVHVPGSGYVGIGVVAGEAVPVTAFEVDGAPLLDRPDLVSPGLGRGREDPDTVEWLVPVRWTVAVATVRSEAYWRRGLFYRRSQNVAELPPDVAAEIERGLRR
jgi:hypothetical protein